MCRLEKVRNDSEADPLEGLLVMVLLIEININPINPINPINSFPSLRKKAVEKKKKKKTLNKFD